MGKNWINRALGLSLICVLIISCTKEDFVDNIEEPVFTSSIPFVSDKELDLVAGDDLYYMFASHTKIGEFDIHSGRFGKENSCETDCLESFTINIHEKESIAGFNPTTTEYPYFARPTNGYLHTYTLQNDDVEDIEKATWKFRNNTFSGSSFSLDSDDINGLQNTMELLYIEQNQFQIKFERPILPKSIACNIEFDIIRNPNSGIFFRLRTLTPNEQIIWSTGENNSIIKWDGLQQDFSATVIDPLGCITYVDLRILSQNLTQNYNVGFEQESVPFISPDNADASVSIEYVSPEGVYYSTSSIGQILPFNFKILNVEDYESNELGNSTKKIEAEFDCILFGEDGTTKRIREGHATFAVSYED